MDLLVFQVTLRVRGEQVVFHGERPEPGPAATDLGVAAVGAFPREVLFAVAECRQKRVRLVLPDSAERAVADVPQRVPLPELREVDVAW